MLTHERAILELVAIIRSGDVLTLASGNVYVSAGSPTNPDHQRWILAALVSVRTEWGFMPIGLNVVVRVTRGNACVWDNRGGLTGQLAMFEEA